MDIPNTRQKSFNMIHILFCLHHTNPDADIMASTTLDPVKCFVANSLAPMRFAWRGYCFIYRVGHLLP